MVGAWSLRSASRSRDKKPTESPIETALGSWTTSAAPPQRVVPAWGYGSLTHDSVAGSTPASMPQPSGAHRMVADNRTHRSSGMLPYRRNGAGLLGESGCQWSGDRSGEAQAREQDPVAGNGVGSPRAGTGVRSSDSFGVVGGLSRHGTNGPMGGEARS
jgi:hypothetical protein